MTPRCASTCAAVRQFVHIPASFQYVGIKGKAFIAGVYEPPERHLPDRTLPQIHADVALGALSDAGLSTSDVDAYYSAGDAPGFGVLSMVDYLGLDCHYINDTETGGSSYLVHAQHAATAIAAGHIDVALITLAGKPRTGGAGPGGSGRVGGAPEAPFESQWGMSVPGGYALAAQRHMHEFGTTSEQLAEIKVAASTHAQHNPHAFLQDVVTVEEVLESPMISDPLHRLDCCVITDGGGLCNNHPANRGGMTKVIEAVRQLRNEANAAVQVPDCELVLAHGTGGSLATRSASSTMILGRSL